MTIPPFPSVNTKESTRIFSITNYRIEKAKNGGDRMEPLDSASAAWLTFIICKQASIC